MPDAAARHGPVPPDDRHHHDQHQDQDHHDDPSAAPSPSPDGGDPLAELVARLRGVGLDPDVAQLCDALWLARWTRPADVAEQAERSAATGGRTALRRAGGQGGGSDGGGRGDRPEQPEPPPQEVGADGRVSLYPVPQDGVPRARGTGRAAALPVGVPAAPALPAPLELQRALRRLQRYRSPAPPLRMRLDETATAERSAQAGGLIMPVHRAVVQGDARLQLVLDASSSMRVWDRLFLELEQVFSQLGAFSDIKVSHLHQGPDGAPAVSRSADVYAAPLHSTDRLSDPTGRRIVLFVSDCAGPLWHSGQAHRLLHHLSRQGPVAVLQPLPQRLWNRTRLPVVFCELSRGETLGGAAALRVRTPAGVPPEVRRGALPVPVLPPEPVALGAWARLLSGAGAGSVPGAVGWVRADQPPAPAGRADRRRTPLERVSRFSSSASPAAGRLAVYLAAAPLCLPVMQLVQRTMLPDSGPSELAEVLVGGLLTRESEEYADDGAQWYRIDPDVRDALLSRLGRDEAMLVLKHCSEYIEQRFGKGGPNFPALALAQLGDGGTGRPYAPAAGVDAAVDAVDRAGRADPANRANNRDTGDNGTNGDEAPVPQPFAEVAARVLRRFMPLPEQYETPAVGTGPGRPEEQPTHQAVRRARALIERFDREGMIQDVIDAVQLLRGATEHERPAGADPELWAEYAHCTLRLWEVQGGDDLLQEAEAAAERAAAHPRRLHERAVLARVLHAAATDRRRRGDPARALDLLRRADREYAVACAAPDLDHHQALRLTLERVRALEAQWRLGGDSALLQGAVGMLEAFADVWPDRRQRPPELPLEHGRILLRLSGATADPVQSRLYAEQGAQSLRTALDTGEAPDTAESARARVRVLLDLVDALLQAGGPLDDAQDRVDEALALVREQGRRAALLARAGRIAVARHRESGDPAELETAADRFAHAAQRMSRDAPAHAEVLAEWGEALLRLAGLQSGARAQSTLSRAIRVLRDCRMETPAGSAQVAHRLLLLGRALMLRYRGRGDRVDLREAEHLFGLAAVDAADPLLAARCRLELGQVQFEAYRSLRRPARLDLAVDAFRDAAESAREAEGAAATERRRHDAVRTGAQAHHWRGMSLEAAARPRAAREAYRAARTEWSRLPEDSLVGDGPTAAGTAERLAALERVT
ncbi:SAV_2336 N-terminal domain-related protein [Streptomyces sp. ME08-AFT2]|uniref:SAV_2336 N-terminal domain-related protein n=1 Tax=Streptomyces sp. ME08-AFT2 TaxID=3028683 RepID=UPI0029A19559|nr:SAV_2336 N-terminal domain-related protein [Streptomyces sp. ME08-AFT2]MDX3308446.1 SAV_2336 N-terminal domain-related protein [Streptomyces sp. ME08-AFT2]